METIEEIKNIFYKVFPFLERWHKTRQFVKFSLVGSTNLFIDFFVYIVLTRFFSVYYLVAQVFSFIASVSWSFFLNKSWTFRGHFTHDIKIQYIKFFAVNITGFGIQTLIMFIGVEQFGLNDILIKAVTTVVVAFWNFFMSKFWVFKLRS